MAGPRVRVPSPSLESPLSAARVGGTEKSRPARPSLLTVQPGLRAPPAQRIWPWDGWVCKGSFPGSSSPFPLGDLLLTGTLNRLCIYALYPLLLENQPRQSHLTPLPRRARVKISWGLGCLLPQRFPWELCRSLRPVTALALIGSRKAPKLPLQC